jgi:hypothetical protein
MPRIACYRDGHYSHHIKYRQAIKYVASGRWRFRGQAEIEQVETVAVPKKIKAFADAPRGSHYHWKPRPSGLLKVWQAQRAVKHV